MTGSVELPERTGPSPLLRPATAINTTYRKGKKKRKEKKLIDKVTN